MSIVNEPKNKNPLIQMIRGLLEHRALWMYLLLDEARKKGLPPETFAPEAIRRCGLYQGKGLVEKGRSSSLKNLKAKLFGLPARAIFEMKICRCTDDNFDVDFHYCPLVKAWQKQGCSDEECAKLCDYAMCGDAGIAETYDATLELPQTIAHGDPICQLQFRKPKGTQSCVSQAKSPWEKKSGLPPIPAPTTWCCICVRYTSCFF
jgi:hypothetical protein